MYEDNLIRIDEDKISFKHYSLFGKKTVSFSNIEFIETKKPTFWNGKYRIHGTGDFKTWFPSDMSRSQRKTIFILKKKQGWWNIGFTVENEKEVKNILIKQGVIKDSI